jgi:hypothetical protein
MEAHIRQNRIDLLGLASRPGYAWERLLDDLKAEHVRGQNPSGKRMTTTVTNEGRIDAFIYRTAPMPDAEVIRILGKHGITATVVADTESPTTHGIPGSSCA